MNGFRKAAALGGSLALAAFLAASVPAGVEAKETDSLADQISVTASSTVKVSPDMAQITFTVDSTGTDAAGTQSANTSDVNNVLAVLTGLGTSAKSITTSDYYLYPVYDNAGAVTGYRVRTTLTVKDIPVSNLGTILTACVQAGINQVSDVSYYCSTYDAVYEQALQQAMKTAAGKAAAIAGAAGRSIEKVSSVTEQAPDTSSRYDTVTLKAQATSNAADTSSMNVMPGEITIEADVTAVYDMN
ncbi:MAG: SIMPL domain-containing protein [Lachnospiraceae bacterium]